MSSVINFDAMKLDAVIWRARKQVCKQHNWRITVSWQVDIPHLIRSILVRTTTRLYSAWHGVLKVSLLEREPLLGGFPGGSVNFHSHLGPHNDAASNGDGTSHMGWANIFCSLPARHRERLCWQHWGVGSETCACEELIILRMPYSVHTATSNPVNNQPDAHFFMYIYFCSLHDRNM